MLGKYVVLCFFLSEVAILLGEDGMGQWVNHSTDEMNQSGASSWTTAQRQAFANDVTNPQLLAVTDNVNESKGDSGPEEWKPSLSEFFSFSFSLLWGDVIKRG
jgi:hypothetical protein